MWVAQWGRHGSSIQRRNWYYIASGQYTHILLTLYIPVCTYLLSHNRTHTHTHTHQAIVVPNGPTEKKLYRLRKKLEAIDTLKKKQEQGETLEANQVSEGGRKRWREGASE